jgi:hypothetical protein
MWFQGNAFSVLKKKEVKKLILTRKNYVFWGTSTETYIFFVMYNAKVSSEDIASQNMQLLATLSDHVLDL